MRIRTRFAPSPTGRLHMGGVRTALFNYLFAKASDGEFILRVEDTDRVRSKKEFETALIEDLNWLGLHYDEGPNMDNNSGPYRQSERTDIYRKLAAKLLDKKLAYRCYCTKERLRELKENQSKSGLPPRYDGRCRELATVPSGTEYVLRFIIPDKEVVFKDLLHGPLTFDRSAYGDFIIMTPEADPTYNFASAVDDGLMSISHVIRGDDHLSNTARQILLMEALGLTPPRYTHLPLVLGENRKPLSKREAQEADISILREKGFLPEAVLNATARLGWAPGKELMTLSKMIEKFSIKRLSKSPSIFAPSLLKRFNKMTISKLSAQKIVELTDLTGITEDSSILYAAVEAVKDNASTLKDFNSLIAPLLNKPNFSAEAAALLITPEAKTLLQSALEELNKGVNSYDNLIKKLKEKTDLKGRALFMPLRCALTGSVKGIELEKTFTLLGTHEVRKRIKTAIKHSLDYDKSSL